MNYDNMPKQTTRTVRSPLDQLVRDTLDKQYTPVNDKANLRTLCEQLEIQTAELDEAREEIRLLKISIASAKEVYKAAAVWRI